MKRLKKIPDHYIGDKHLTNWFIKNLGMADLHLVFIHPDYFLRDELTKSSVNLLITDSLLQFKDGKLIKMKGLNITFTKE